MNLSSGYPFWLVKNGLPYTYDKLARHISTDVLIMGGGISGALVAYYLVEAGIDCVVVDARTIGLGSTCASTSLLQYEIDTPLVKLIDKVGEKQAVASYRLCSSAIDELQSIARTIKFADFQRRPSVYYAAHPSDLRWLKKEFTARKEAGFAVEYVTARHLKAAFHFSASAAIVSEQAAQTDAYSFTHALHQYGIKRGLRVYDRTTVKDVHRHKTGLTAVTTDGRSIKAKKLVYATGYEALKHLDKKIARLHSTYAIVSEQLDSDADVWKDNALIWNTADPYLYLRVTNDRRIMIGGRDVRYYNPLKRDALLKSKSSALARDFRQLFPGITFKPEFSWTGTFATSKDGLPYIGRYEKYAHSFFALGFGGNGITFSQVAAEIIRDEIKGKKNPAANIFSFAR